MKFRSLFFQTAVIVFLTGLLGACGPATSEADVLRVAVPPNPNIVPLFVMMEQQEDLMVEIVPVPGIPELTAALQGGQADAALFFSAAGAKLYNKEALPDLRLWSINVWRALYLVADPQVGGLDDLVGQKILASFPGGAPDLVMRAAMRQAGFDPDADFIIEYLPSDQVKLMLLAGKGDAALLPEPQVSALIIKAEAQGLPLGAVVDLQTGFESDGWEAGLTPLGALFTTQSLLDDPVRRAALEDFDAGYSQACAYATAHPEETGKIVERAFAEYFGGQLPAQSVANAIQSGRLVFKSCPAGELHPDLDSFLKIIVGQAPEDEFFAAP
ncbi:MAG: ABC transporter substrate-binding protein [Chloroflexi bacterium]|nr:ABC transporter substrate-binding protein [Chloroflexota bacterium]